MTSLVVRVYRSEQQASDAVARLKELGFGDDSIHLVAPVSTDDAASLAGVSQATAAGFLWPDKAEHYVTQVRHGRWVVAVRAPFGSGRLAIDCLEQVGPVDTGLERAASEVSWDTAAPLSSGLRAPPLWPNRPAPLSRLLGLPLLSGKRTFENKFAELTDPNWSLSSRIGLPLLSRRQAGWASLTGQSGPSWTRSLGVPLLSAHPTPFSALLGLGVLCGPLRRGEAAPFSALFGLPTLSQGLSLLSRLVPPLASSRFALFGRNPLIDRPAPLSSLIGLPLLREEPAPLSRRIGQPLLLKEGAWLSSLLTLPLLSRSPTPLSSLLHLPVLSRYQ